MADLKHKYPRFVYTKTDIWEAVRRIVRSIELMYELIVDSVNSRQTKDAELDILYYEQATEPTIVSEGNAVLWKDTDDSKVYLVFKNSDGQKKVELT